MGEIRSPNKIEIEENKQYLFLVGDPTTERQVTRSFGGTNWVVLNPRRIDWDCFWVQSIDNPQFRERVEWELEALTIADRIIFYFDPKIKSPNHFYLLSLLELGLFAKSSKMIVICPEEFWQKGYLDIVCRKYGVKQVNNLEEALKLIEINDTDCPL